MLRIAVIACIAAAYVPTALAQTPHDTFAIEIASARRMLESFDGRPILLLRDLALPDQAPGQPSGTLRDSTRNVALARAIGASIGPARIDRAVRVFLSAPVFGSATARITVTVSLPPTAPEAHDASYETRALMFVRVRGSWRIQREVQLGIS